MAVGYRVIPRRSGAGWLPHSDSMFAHNTVAIAQVEDQNVGRF